MKWSYRQLQQLGDEPLQVNETLHLEKSIQARRPDIISLTPVIVTGVVGADKLSAFSALQVRATIVLPSTRSLKPVALKLSFMINENYVESSRTDFSEFSKKDLVLVLDHDILDLDQLVADNILLQIPMQVLTDAEKKEHDSEPVGHDWQVLTENQLRKQQKGKDKKVDPRLEKLAHFFDDSDK